MPARASFARVTLIRSLGRSALAALVLALASFPAPVFAEDDASLCLVTAERVEAGETLSAAERQEAHEACVRALSDTASVVQKYQFQEADFTITGKRDSY